MKRYEIFLLSKGGKKTVIKRIISIRRAIFRFLSNPLLFERCYGNNYLNFYRKFSTGTGRRGGRTINLAGHGNFLIYSARQ